jgi:hypothetical protein
MVECGLGDARGDEAGQRLRVIGVRLDEEVNVLGVP